jgi:hypothetical protein
VPLFVLPTFNHFSEEIFSTSGLDKQTEYSAGFLLTNASVTLLLRCPALLRSLWPSPHPLQMG